METSTNSIGTKVIIVPKRYKTEYATVKINKVVKMKHRVILEQYLGRKLKGVVHHIDGNTRNNELNNLQEMSLKEHSSLHHAGKTGYKSGWIPKTKVSEEKINEIIEFKKKNMSLFNYQIAEKFNLSDTKVGNILKKVGLNRKYLSPEDENKINRIRRLP